MINNSRFRIQINKFFKSRQNLVRIAFILALAFLLFPNKVNSETIQISLNEIQFEFIDDSNGYIFLGGEIFWTSNAGADWLQITPQDMENFIVEDIYFLDPKTGYILISKYYNNENKEYYLLETLNSGSNWKTKELDIPFGINERAIFEKVDIFFINEYVGWISFSISSSSNFSSGVLFRTQDAGKSWERLSIPFSAPVYFIDQDIGWIAGGLMGNMLFKTEDGGTSWKQIRLPQKNNYDIIIHTPFFFNKSDGILPVFLKDEKSPSILIYTTEDTGNNWILQSSYRTTSFEQDFITSGVKSTNTFGLLHKQLLIYENTSLVNKEDLEEGIINDITSLFMITQDKGFAEVNKAECFGDSANKDHSSWYCTESYQLIKTLDGGISWETIELPLVNTDNIVLSQHDNTIEQLEKFSLVDGKRGAEIFIGQGFDICEIPSISQLKTWFNLSPYKAVNLYIGGSSRGCSNSILSPTFIQQAYQQGWKFIPTWVGPQAPCSIYSSKMSSDVSVAYAQGVAEATKAVDDLYWLGFTHPDKSGSIVYYDMEAYSGDATCYDAVNSFINGWSYQLKELGSLSGVYGATCGSHLSNFFTIPNPPDAIWPAAWYHSEGTGYYNANASVWGAICLSDSVYTNHQRIRQYEGSHFENWGSLALKIDSNVIDGVVAIPALGNSNVLCPNPTPSTVYVCNPTLSPSYTNPCDSYWYPVPGYAGNFAYLTENAQTIGESINSGIWLPVLQKAGIYKVETYIPKHEPFSVSCSWGTATLSSNTNNAKYIINSLNGETEVSIDQSIYSDEWVSLGEYYFESGNQGYIYLSDLTEELNRSKSISFSAMRLTLLSTNNPIPNIIYISPNSVPIGGSDLKLTISGNNFMMGSKVYLDGTEITTSYINNTQLSAIIEASVLTSINQHTITISNPEPGGGTSNDYVFYTTTFVDVPGNAWYWRWVEGFYSRGITSGCAVEPFQFCPERNVTRAEMAVFILRAKYYPNYEPGTSTTGIFDDIPVPRKEWMQIWVEEFYKEGITTGCSINPLLFCPEREVTRAEMAVFVLRAIHGPSYEPPAATGIFFDVPVKGKEWMQPWIEEFYREGITTGCSINPLKFCPEQNVTRAEMAVFIDRAFGFAQLP